MYVASHCLLWSRNERSHSNQCYTEPLKRPSMNKLCVFEENTHVCVSIIELYEPRLCSYKEHLKIDAIWRTISAVIGASTEFGWTDRCYLFSEVLSWTWFLSQVMLASGILWIWHWNRATPPSSTAMDSGWVWNLGRAEKDVGSRYVSNYQNKFISKKFQNQFGHQAVES